MDSSNQTEELKQQRLDQLLVDIEGVDEYWGPTFRSIFEYGDSTKFLDSLDGRIKNYDKDIERMCNHNYQGFIDSIRELLQLKSQVHKLNQELLSIDKELQDSVKSVLDKEKELIKARRVQKYIASTIEHLSLCLPVLTMFIKLEKQMQEKRYYSALKTLEQLEHNYLQRLPNYEFSMQMGATIPKLREDIKSASMSELKDFLENIRRFSPVIGEVAMRHTAEQLSGHSDNSSRQKTKFGLSDIPDGITGQDDEDISAQDRIDLSPVYRSMHIYSVLNAKDEFQSYYRGQRKKQARLVLQPPPNMHEDIERYKAYINSIVGFFVIEDHVLNTAESLASRAYLDEVWQLECSNIIATLSSNTSCCTDASLMLQIKNLVMLFSMTLRNYGYSVGKLLDMLHELRDHYNEVLMKLWVKVFRDILDKETFSPIHVANESELELIIAKFPLTENYGKEFPKKLPFSWMVPKIYKEVEKYIQECWKFSEDLELSQSSINDMIRKSTTLLLTRTFSGSLSSLFRKPGLGVLQVVQILTDIGYLEGATEHLDKFMRHVTGCDAISHTHALRPTMFHVARDDAQKQISSKLCQKIDEFLELDSYDWNLVEPQGTASGFIKDLISFLEGVFASLAQGPSSAVKESTARAACNHIAQALLSALLADSVKNISMGALSQLDLDTLQCEQFAASLAFVDEQSDMLRYFSTLRQLLNLVTVADWNAYFHDFGQETSKYPDVSPPIIIKLLEKLTNDQNRNMFTVLKKSERDKKKLLDTVLKQLKQLAVTALGTD